MKPETLALHHGYAPDDQHAVAVPIHQTRACQATMEAAASPRQQWGTAQSMQHAAVAAWAGGSTSPSCSCGHGGLPSKAGWWPSGA